jgi:hypothetical protein
MAMIKIPDRNNLKEEEFILAHDLRGFHALGQKIMAGACGRGTFSLYSGQKAERSNRKGREKAMP